MKIFQVLISSAVVLAQDSSSDSGDGATGRKFANKPKFLQGTDKSDTWDQARIEAYLPKLENEVQNYINQYIPNTNKPGRAKAGRMAKHLKDTRGQMQRLYNKPECRKNYVAPARKRRDDSSNDDYNGGDDLMKWKIPVGDADKATNGMFWVHARWVRNELLDNCETQAMAVLRRLDRLRAIWRWQFCNAVDSSPAYCAKGDYTNQLNPRGTKKLKNRYPGTGNRS